MRNVGPTCEVEVWSWKSVADDRHHHVRVVVGRGAAAECNCAESCVVRRTASENAAKVDDESDVMCRRPANGCVDRVHEVHMTQAVVTLQCMTPCRCRILEC